MASTASPLTPTQAIRFCRSADPVRIAYAVHGAGPPLVIDACGYSTAERHLQNVYAKLDVCAKSARTTAVARLLTPA